MADPGIGHDDDGMWARLRRRKVVQWGMVYLAGAWGFLQGLEYVGDAFGWPAQLRPLAIIALAVGLPIVLVVAWYHGDRGEQRVTGVELTILTLLFLLGGGFFWRFERPIHSATPPATAPAPAPAPAPSAKAEPRPSIAVLPFENRSAKPEDVFFVDGIHDDILTQLAKIGAMRVIARTSVEQFRGTKLTTREIGARLGVATVLEGGVQRAGNRVRISVQLIDAATDGHLWAESYDRNLTATNIFAIQSDVANAIAAALKTTLTPLEQARVNLIPTGNLEAWEQYQLGRRSLASRNTSGMAEAQGHFRKALELDPRFAAAYAGLADAIWLEADYSGAPFQPAVARAQALLEEALRLDPNLAEAIATSAKFAEMRGDVARAESGFRRAIELNPSYAQAYLWYALLLAKQSRREEFLRHVQVAMSLDPLSAQVMSYYAGALEDQDRYGEALGYYKRIIELEPDNAIPYLAIGDQLVYVYGRIDRAIPWFFKALELDRSNVYVRSSLGLAYLILGDDGTAARLIGEALRSGAGSDVALATAGLNRLYGGDIAAARSLALQALAIEPRNAMAHNILVTGTKRTTDAMAVRQRLLDAYPELGVSGGPKVQRDNFQVAVGLAMVLQQTGERDRAAQLLDATLKFIRTIPRGGRYGYQVEYARIYSLKGRKAEALEALRQAEQAGLRGFWRDAKIDPALASIRDEPEFRAIIAAVEADVAAQRARLAARPKDAPLDLGDLAGR